MTLSSNARANGLRAFDVIKHMVGPGPDGVEGVAIPPASGQERWVVLTDDENTGDRAILLYEEFDPH